jgi:hypothetical protein
MCDHLFFDFTPLLNKFSTSTHPFCPRVQTTVASSVPATVSKIRHFMSSTLGQGQSFGSATQSKVAGQRYCKHDTKWRHKIQVYEVQGSTYRYRSTPAQIYVVAAAAAAADQTWIQRS